MPDGPYIPVARIVRPHGVRGELSVTPVIDIDLDSLTTEEVWIVPPVQVAAPHRIESVRPGPKGVLVKLDRVDDVETARACANAVLSVHESVVSEDLRVPPFDPVGCEVLDEERGSLGTITDVIVTGANDVWIVQGDSGEVLIPVIDDVILEIDQGSRTIDIRLLPGLLEE